MYRPLLPVSVFAALALAWAAPLRAEPAAAPLPWVAQSGAEPGAWTQDWDAARVVAAGRGVPLLALFASSDTPGGRRAAKAVAAPDWKAWASTNLYLVFFDFPQSAKTVPAEWSARNARVRETCRIRTLPAFALFDGRDAPVRVFGLEEASDPDRLRLALLDLDSSKDARRAALGDADAAKYDVLLDRVRSAEADVEAARLAMNSLSAHPETPQETVSSSISDYRKAQRERDAVRAETDPALAAFRVRLLASPAFAAPVPAAPVPEKKP